MAEKPTQPPPKESPIRSGLSGALAAYGLDPASIAEAVGSATVSIAANAEAEALQPGLAGGEKPKRETPRSSRGSTLPIRGGKREVKAYALTEDELTTLGAIQGLAALFFSLGGISFGVWLSIKLQLAFVAAKTDPQTMGYWQGLQAVTKWVAIGCAALGFGLFLFNYWRVRKIKKGTVH